MKQTDISKKTRFTVLKRDSVDDWPCCIVCGQPSEDWKGAGLHIHHVLRRSQGGLGAKENLVTLCGVCHSKLHSGDSEIQKYCEEYLVSLYKDKAMPKGEI